MKKTILLSIVVCMFISSYISADTFGTGANQFDIDFVTISGDASSANGTNLSRFPPSKDQYKTFSDPGNFRIGIHEITNDQWNKFVTVYGMVTGSQSTAYDEDVFWTDDNLPINNVSWYEAYQFVNWLNVSTGHTAAYKFIGTQGTSDYTLTSWDASDSGYNPNNRYRNSNAKYFLPTEDEWVKAAYWNGTNLQEYATKIGEILHQGDGISGTGWNYYDDVYTTRPLGPWNVGSGSEELNGTYDMMGNVWEMTDSLYYVDSISVARSTRGGSYESYNYAQDALYFANRYNPIIPTDEYEAKGFRVASVVPEPATLSLLTLGGLALLRKRK